MAKRVVVLFLVVLLAGSVVKPSVLAATSSTGWYMAGANNAKIFIYEPTNSNDRTFTPEGGRTFYVKLTIR